MSVYVNLCKRAPVSYTGTCWPQTTYQPRTSVPSDAPSAQMVTKVSNTRDKHTGQFNGQFVQKLYDSEYCTITYDLEVFTAWRVTLTLSGEILPWQVPPFVLNRQFGCQIGRKSILSSVHSGLWTVTEHSHSTFKIRKPSWLFPVDWTCGHRIINDPKNNDLGLIQGNYEILGRWFKNEKIRSLVRQMNLYGFSQDSSSTAGRSWNRI
jgi:hypothetical protein